MNALPREKGLFGRAAVTSALLGAFFFLVYGTCNWITSQRGDVGTWFYEWEKSIPFVPEFVVPYYSLDLFFVGAFFLCRSKLEMTTLAKRVLVVIVASGICFLLFPLQLGMERPVPESGWTVPLFKLLHAQDMPYNLAPSLHISLRSIFWVTYGRHLRGWVRTVTKLWFVLIGVSTLLVWQHHLMDVVTGFLMAWVVMAFIPDRETQFGPLGWMGKVTPRHRQLALRYGMAAIACGLLALPGGGFLWFGWPAIGLGVVCLSYATANPRWLQKSSGTLSPAAEWMLLPVMLGTQWWQRRWMNRPYGSGEVDTNVWFGRRPDGKRVEDLLKTGCVAVLDLTVEFNASVRLRERVVYGNMGWLDLTHPSVDELLAAVGFIDEHQMRGLVYVHCQLGLLRSASVAAAWLIHAGKAKDVDDAVEMIRSIEPMAVLHGEALNSLRQLHELGAVRKRAVD